jgi:hypothetical protein
MVNWLDQSDLSLSIAKGLVPRHSFVAKFGNNPTIDAATPEDVWDGGAIYVFPTTARLHDITSTSINDDGEGSPLAGARTLEIQGLDINYNEIGEIVTLNGTADVETQNSYLRVYRMIVRTAGATGSNVGTITATAQVDTTVSAQITIGKNQTLMSVFTIPAGKTGYVTNVFGSMGVKQAGSVDFEFLVRPFGEVFQVKLQISTAAYVQHKFSPYSVVTEKSDLKVRADVSANGSNTSAGYSIILVVDN